MGFNKTVFVKHYGRPYVLGMKVTAIVFGISAIITLLMVLLDLEFPEPLRVLVGSGLGFTVFPIFPLFFCYYVKYLNESKRQMLKISNGEIQLKMVPVDGFTWGGMEKDIRKYTISQITGVRLTSRYIEVYGSVTCVRNHNGHITEVQSTCCRIPRNFDNEDKIISIGGC